MSDTKSEGQILAESLSFKNKNVWETVSDEFNEAAFDFCEGYKSFLNKAKTEREFTSETERLIVSNGFVSINEIISANKKLEAGMKVYSVNRSKAIVMSIIGKKAIEDGVNLLGAHIDSPRIDLKQNPIYEDSGFVLMKTHYYGGIKKYQWVTIPLSLHGVVVKQNGEIINISIGEDLGDTVFTITDLLPHLAQDQMQKKMAEAIVGEGLNLLIGSIPYKDEKVKDKIKLNILKLLNEKYGIIEEDFVSAELEIVPAFKASDVGLDRSLVGAYGQDDKVCAYASLMALINLEQPDKTAISILTDKEEIGSMGNTGAESIMLENFIAQLCFCSSDKYSDIMLRKCLSNSKMLSADVNPGVDPNYEGVQDKKNASYLGNGLVLQKYTGSRGKVGGSDANAEFIAELRKIFNEDDIIWQAAELGKVDQGGGGTIAQYVANMGVEVIDCGVAILSMHSPFEITSKIDIYMMYKAYMSFLKKD